MGRIQFPIAVREVFDILFFYEKGIKQKICSYWNFKRP